MQDKLGLLKAHAAMTSVALFYGVNYFTLKAVLEKGHSPFGILALRCIIATLVFFLFHTLVVKEKIRETKDYLRLLLCALFGVSINQTLFLWGLSETSRVNSSVLMVTTPVFVFLVAALLKEEKITIYKVIGLIVSMAGAVGLMLASATDAFSISGSTIFGDMLIMINASSYGIYLVLVRPLVVKYNTFTIIKWIFLFGSVPNIIIGFNPLVNIRFGEMGGQEIFGIFFLIMFATLGAYFLNAWAMKNVKASAVGIYIYLQPIFVTLGSAILLLNEINTLKLLFILLIFAGVWLVTLFRR